jgi:DNA-binding NtrC family response regulator
MQEVYNLIARVAPTMATCSWSAERHGKELVAETIHALSRRDERPFWRRELRRDFFRT